ncbi:hypothetical protein [Desulfosporosinus sp. SB140]|uniref:hypothetical protein n=1 Tax=Desulfosporosinus paludis TaxID=3115649 RepID=UPI00388D9E2D
MKEADNDILWAQLFQDKPIPNDVLLNFQSQIMKEINAHPVDFEAQTTLAKRRKWGLGLAISLVIAVISFALIVWLKKDWIYQALNTLVILITGIHAAEFQDVWHGMLRDFTFLRELKTGLSLLWGIVAWPLFGLASVYIVLTGSTDTRSPRKSMT